MLSDLRYAVRSFRKTPALTAIVIITLALGIGANTAIFSVIDAVLLRPTPLQHIDRLAMVWETDRNTGTTREPASFPDYLDFKARSRTFEDLAAVMAGEVNLTPERGDPVRLPVLQLSANALPMLGLPPLAGRTFTAEEDRPGGPAGRPHQRAPVGTLVRSTSIGGRRHPSPRRSSLSHRRRHA